jgi:hypothetical protein
MDVINTMDPVIMVETPTEAVFSRKFFSPTVVAIADYNLLVLGLDSGHIIVYSGLSIIVAVRGIMCDPAFTKLVVKTPKALTTLLNLDNCVNCIHVNSYFSDNGYKDFIPDVKRRLLDLGQMNDPIKRACAIIHMLFSFKIRVREKIKFGKDTAACFNVMRDAYLFYMTVFNAILLRDGPQPFGALVRKADNYKYTRNSESITIKLPSTTAALLGLIESGMYVNNKGSTMISLIV